jgi:peptide/nickel transport system permease protein
VIETNLALSEPFTERMRLFRKRVEETGRVFKRNRMGMLGLAILLVFVAMAAFPAQIMWVFSAIGDWDYPYGPHDELASVGRGTAPSPDHWLGTDYRGNDILARLIYGARISLMIGILASAVTMALGSMVGLLSGFWGGWRDEILMRVTDVFLVLPWLVLMIVFNEVLPGGPSITKVTLVIGITGWAGTARIVRTQVLSVKKRAFIERARSVGAGEFHIIRKHIFPNVFPLIFANAILTVALAILSESALSFLGMGAAATVDVTWGNMLEDALKANAMYNGFYLWVIMPGLCIVFLVMGFTFIGYALDEIFNPRLRKR